MADQNQQPQSQEEPSLSSNAPVIFDPPEHEDLIKGYEVTAVHVVALPPEDCKADRNQWLILLQVEGDQGCETVQLDLVESRPGPRAIKCNVLCHKGPELGPNGHVAGMAKEAKMNVVPGHTVKKILGKLEACGLLYYRFVIVKGLFLPRLTNTYSMVLTNEQKRYTVRPPTVDRPSRLRVSPNRRFPIPISGPGDMVPGIIHSVCP